jgi:hypothetical protein
MDTSTPLTSLPVAGDTVIALGDARIKHFVVHEANSNASLKEYLPSEQPLSIRNGMQLFPPSFLPLTVQGLMFAAKAHNMLAVVNEEGLGTTLCYSTSRVESVAWFGDEDILIVKTQNATLFAFVEISNLSFVSRLAKRFKRLFA